LIGFELFFDDGGGEPGNLLGQALGGGGEVAAEGLGGLDNFALIGGLELGLNLGGGGFRDF
jgi:hypothetical protein